LLAGHFSDAPVGANHVAGDANHELGLRITLSDATQLQGGAQVQWLTDRMIELQLTSAGSREEHRLVYNFLSTPSVLKKRQTLYLNLDMMHVQI
jgi:hypothetical protein